MIAASLPIRPQDEADNERLIALLADLDEREKLTACASPKSTNGEQ